MQTSELPSLAASLDPFRLLARWIDLAGELTQTFWVSQQITQTCASCLGRVNLASWIAPLTPWPQRPTLSVVPAMPRLLEAQTVPPTPPHVPEPSSPPMPSPTPDPLPPEIDDPPPVEMPTPIYDPPPVMPTPIAKAVSSWAEEAPAKAHPSAWPPGEVA